ncbi:MAG: heme NO-binding domain-containing protein [Verrucomicrobiae bacterium]|nr:heme NO-binding domain-containing protein [Verrucomicrobiae bacterium]
MKGIIFTEFLDLVEKEFGFEMQDAIIEECDLPSGGSYTSVGTYNHLEIVALVSKLSEKTTIPVPDLLQIYGEHLFGRFTQLYGGFFTGETTAFEFLESVESQIHVEVLKLYPTAQLPRFDTKRISEDSLEMIYHSGRHLEDVAQGLIRGCLKHFGEPAEIQRDPASDDGGVRFVITRTPAAIAS